MKYMEPFMHAIENIQNRMLRYSSTKKSTYSSKGKTRYAISLDKKLESPVMSINSGHYIEPCYQKSLQRSTGDIDNRIGYSQTHKETVLYAASFRVVYIDGKKCLIINSGEHERIYCDPPYDLSDF
jgi:hypothetical protein